MFCLSHEREDLRRQITITKSRLPQGKRIRGSRVYRGCGFGQRKAQKKVFIGTRLDVETRQKFLAFLNETKYCFSWDISDMPRIDPKVITQSSMLIQIPRQLNKKEENFPPEKIKSLAKKLKD